MLNETLNQPHLLLIFLVVGLVGGIVFDIGNFIKFLFSNKKVPSVILDIIQTALCMALIYVVNIKFNYGELRLFPFVCFLMAFSLERFTIGKLIAKIYLSCYNFFTKLVKKLWSKKKCKSKQK